MAAKAQRSNYFPISTSHTNIDIESLTFLTSELFSRLRTSCRNRPMNAMGGIGNNKAAVCSETSLCALTVSAGGQPWRCVEGQCENAVRAVTDLASPQAEIISFNCSFFGPPGSGHLSGRKATAIITQQAGRVLCISVSLFWPSLGNHSWCF